MTNLDFLNKNMYRKYPFRASCDLTFTDGRACPQELITSVQISTIYGHHTLFVSKIFVSSDFISVTINDYIDGAVLGCFSSKINSDYQAITLQPKVSYISGNMTVGLKTDLKKLPKGTYYLRNELTNTGSRDNGLLEDSAIFCFSSPAVTSIRVKNNTLTGKLTTAAGENTLVTSPTSSEINLAVINTNLIKSNNDYSGVYGNCNTPIIKKINTVFPDVDGNIDIYGISPITIDVASGELSFESGLELVDICPEKNKLSPPVDNTDTYLTDILTAIAPEWRSWPNFS